MKRVAIIGVGLIGGSLGMALKRSRKGYRVTGLGRDPRKLALARRRGAIDAGTTDWAAGVADADIVVLCTPVDAFGAALRRIVPFLRSGAVVTDAISVKGAVLREADPFFRAGARAHFVGAHPMAGSEKGGVAHARADLYRGARTVLVPHRRAPRAAREAVARLWRDAGSRTLVMSAAAHDRAVAAVSHAPHVLAFLLCLFVDRRSRADRRTAELVAGSFRDMTRIADSSPSDWAGICAANRGEVARALDELAAALREGRQRLSSPARIARTFAAGAAARRRLLGARAGGA